MDVTFDLSAKPLSRALISYAVRSIGPETGPDSAPKTHFEWLQAGVIRAAIDVTDTALGLLGRSSISSGELPREAPVIIGFSLLMMLGIAQAVNKEGIALDMDALAERLIGQQLAQKTRAAGSDEGVKKAIQEIARTAAQIPGQIVDIAKGEVEELFRTCYAVLPEYVRGNDETRRQLMPIFGTALLLLLQSEVRTND